MYPVEQILFCYLDKQLHVQIGMLCASSYRNNETMNGNTKMDGKITIHNNSN